VKHGEEWLDTSRCPCCGARAVIELAKPVMECDECGGSGHVAHLETVEPRGPSALRLALGQARDALRIRPKEAS
jgi:ribosomal protein L37AE/L43A